MPRKDRDELLASVCKETRGGVDRVDLPTPEDLPVPVEMLDDDGVLDIGRRTGNEETTGAVGGHGECFGVGAQSVGALPEYPAVERQRTEFSAQSVTGKGELRCGKRKFDHTVDLPRHRAGRPFGELIVLVSDKDPVPADNNARLRRHRPGRDQVLSSGTICCEDGNDGNEQQQESIIHAGCPDCSVRDCKREDRRIPEM